MAMDVNELGLCDHELIVHAIREVTMIAAKAIEPGEDSHIVAQVLAVLAGPR